MTKLPFGPLTAILAIALTVVRLVGGEFVIQAASGI